MLPQRFWDKVNKTETCWYWTGAITAWGYPKYRTYRHVDSAYRVAYADAHGPIADGMEIDHVCHTVDTSCTAGADCLHRRCVNPDHLEMVEPIVNLRRAHRGSPATCKNGHARTDENTVVRRRSNGLMARDCRICTREGKARRRAEAKARRVADRTVAKAGH